jgi:hypothetical protein
MAELGLLFQSLSDIGTDSSAGSVAGGGHACGPDRLEHLNPRLNAVLTNLGEQALEAARPSSTWSLVSLAAPHGVPLALKDTSRCEAYK